MHLDKLFAKRKKKKDHSTPFLFLFLVFPFLLCPHSQSHAWLPHKLLLCTNYDPILQVINYHFKIWNTPRNFMPCLSFFFSFFSLKSPAYFLKHLLLSQKPSSSSIIAIHSYQPISCMHSFESPNHGN